MMAPSCSRLYLAVKQLQGVEGQTAVGRILGASPQTMRNWEIRGVSECGALNAQRILKCDAIWILDGVGGLK